MMLTALQRDSISFSSFLRLKPLVKARRDFVPKGLESVEPKAERPAQLRISLKELVEEARWPTFHLFIREIDQHCLWDNRIARGVVIPLIPWSPGLSFQYFSMPDAVAM